MYVSNGAKKYLSYYRSTALLIFRPSYLLITTIHSCMLIHSPCISCALVSASTNACRMKIKIYDIYINIFACNYTII